ncbi:MAG: helix-turn-helix domain-containing protein [Oscillospiraceae bacterium]
MINGSYIRQLRKSNHYTLAQLSEETGYTASFLSQIERGLKEPSLTALRKLSASLGVPVPSFFSSEEDTNSEEIQSGEGYSAVVRWKNRKPVYFPGSSTLCEAITPTSVQGKELSLHGLIYTIQPGQFCSEGMINHSFDECTYVLQGEMQAFLADQETCLQAGDCLYVQAGTRHNFRNCGEVDCVLLSFSG